MHKTLALVLAAIGFFLSTGASAQGVFDLGPLSDTVRQSGNAIAQPAPPEQVSKAKDADFTFEVSQPLRAENARRFIEGVGQQDPEAAKALAGQDLVGSLAPSLEAIGLKTNDMADAYTMWLMSVFGLYRDLTEDATPRQIAGTRKMVAASMVGSEALLKAPDAEKQKFAESMILQALVNTWISESLKQMPERKPEFQKEFYRSAKQDMGVDLDRFDYGADGLYAKPQ